MGSDGRTCRASGIQSLVCMDLWVRGLHVLQHELSILGHARSSNQLEGHLLVCLFGPCALSMVPRAHHSVVLSGP